MEQAYTAIGRAVASAQIFETVLVPIFEFFRMRTEPGYLEKTDGFVSAGAFKVPVKNIIKALSVKGDIAADLETRLTSYVEDRHLLVHRWFQANGWPAEDDAVGFAPIIELANRVEHEAKDLTRLFAGYMVKFVYPESTDADGENFKARMATIFHRAHLE